MKIIITEKQYDLINQDVLRIPSLDLFGGWNGLQRYLEKKGNPLYSIDGDLDLFGSVGIKSLGNLTSVGGYLDLYGSNIQSLGNLKSVGSYLDLIGLKIKTLGNLTYVGGDLYAGNTPISKMYSEEEIKDMVNVKGKIYM